MPATALRVSQLLTNTSASFDHELAAFTFRRVVPVAIYVEAGKESRRLGREIARDAKAILKDLGYGETTEWGTFEGSFVQLNINKGGEPEDESTFLDKMRQARTRIAEKAADKLKKFPWKRAGKIAVGGVKVAVIVGTAATVIAAGPAALTIGTFVVPAKIWFAIDLADRGIRAVDAVRRMFVDSPPAVQAQPQATTINLAPTPSNASPPSATTATTSAPNNDAEQRASAQRIHEELDKQKEKARRFKPR